MRGRHVHRLDSFNSCRESNTKASIRLLVRVDQMLLEVLGHPETLLPLCAKDSLHSFVRSEELLVGRVLRRAKSLLYKKKAAVTCKFFSLRYAHNFLITWGRDTCQGKVKTFLSTFKEIVHLLALLGPDDLGKLRGDVEGHLKASQLLLSFLGHGSWWKIVKRSTAQCCFLLLLRFLLTLRLAVEWKDLYSMHDDG